MSKKETEELELAVLRARVTELEAERDQLIRQTNEVVAELQDRVYWLDRWHIDLNTKLEQPRAKEFRAYLEMLAAVVKNFLRKLRSLTNKIGGQRRSR